MNELELLLNLTGRMEKLFEGYTVMIRKGEEEAASGVKVFAQYMPQPEGIRWSDESFGLKGYAEDDYAKNFPCVIVKLGERQDFLQANRESSAISIKILAGIYDSSEDCQSYREVINMIVKIRECITKERIMSRACLLKMPVKTQLIEADTWPVYFAELSLQYDLPMPQMTHEYIYGRRELNGRGIYEGRFDEEHGRL